MGARGTTIDKPGVYIGDRIRERLATINMSQSELARRVSLTQGTIAGLITGRSRSSSHIHRIARELGTTPAYLSGETDDPTSDAPDEETLSSETRELLAAFDTLSSRDRRALVQIATSLAAANDPTPTLHDKRQDYRGRSDR